MESQNEVWKDIIGYEGIYAISNLGRVKRYAHKQLQRNNIFNQIADRINKFSKAAGGYCRIGLHNNKVTKTFSMHRLIAIHFIPNPENKPHINHINGIRNDNRIENLEWCTASENVYHTYKLRWVK